VQERSDILDHISKLRERLLDLTLRNRLIAFAHSATGSLRVVDELPDQLFKKLVDGSSLYFSAIPEPTERELRQYHSDGSRVPRAEVELQRLSVPRAEVWAKYNGYATDYELPVEVDDGERPKKHDDSFIQTLLYSADLDRRLRKLRSDARTAIEESGVNMLYLAFGFLEWTDGKAAQGNHHLAPLLLLPVELKRSVRGRSVDYALSWTGEDIQKNLSLAKKLELNYDLALPDIAEGEEPESYFHNVRRAVHKQETWRVRRYVTLSLFNFGKLLLYIDLDPNRWGVSEPLAEKPLVKSVLGASESDNDGGGSGEAPDFLHIDTELNLVDRADSSQAEALQFALRGNSLVIHGPPGTGKSQTITNLIAAALAGNKTVLFVSEKLAALEVVRRRLRELGLGEFCLELHSNKTRKQTLIKDLESRLKVAKKLPRAEGMKQAKDKQTQIRNRIEEFASLLELPLGNMEKCLSDVLFEAGRARLELGALAQSLSAAANLHAREIGRAEYQACEAFLSELKGTVNSAGGAENMRRHPWRGVSTQKLLAPDATRAAKLADEWASAAEKLKAELLALKELIGAQLACSTTSAKLSIGLPSLVKEAATLSEALHHAAWVADQVELYLEAKLPAAGSRFSVSRKIVELANSLPERASVLRGPWLYDHRADDVLQRVEALCMSIAEDTAIASKSLDLRRPVTHSVHELRAASGRLRSTSLVSVVSNSWRKARAVWRTYALATTQRIVPDALEALARLLESRESLQTDSEAEAVLGDLFLEDETDIASLKDAKGWAEQVRSSLAEEALADKLLMLDPETLGIIAAGVNHEAYKSVQVWADLESANEPTGTDAWLSYVVRNFAPSFVAYLAPSSSVDWRRFELQASSLAQAYQTYQDAFEQFAAQTGLDITEWFYGQPADELDEIITRARQAAQSSEELRDWLKVQSLLEAAPNPACLELARDALEGRCPLDRLPTIFRYFVYDGLARDCFEKHPSLRALRGRTLNSLRESFRSADEALMELRRVEIAQQLASRPVPEGRFSQRVSDLTEAHLLRNEISKSRRHIPIRRLVERAGRALQALKPCFMMGPMSVAQYLQPGALRFDLIIMDEASQLRPEDAVGALARGDQAVIVGDPKQLPPTSFFDTALSDTGNADEDEGAYIAQISESILDLAQITFTHRMLRWHYRSRHPSLIQFSNSEFYDNELVVFPSPSQENERYGLTCQFVGGTFVDNVNRDEAKQIALAAVDHLRTHPSRSLGVVAMNVHQKELIEAEIEALASGDPLLFSLTENSEGKTEPFFVKNLENVQGDERDVIMISMTYGPETPGGRVPQRFGPINQEVGWRRLNVLFTRAKERMHVITSMRAQDIVLADNASRGTQALKSFLKFLEVGRNTRVYESQRQPDSDFEHAVLEGLAGLGYRCVPQLGVAGFFLDIAVCDPDQPGEFVAGIECDGKTYHSTKSARDRDRLRQDILEDLGWEIERIWSVDWFQDPRGELMRVHTKLQQLIAKRRSERETVSVVGELLRASDPRSEMSSPSSAELDPNVPGTVSGVRQPAQLAMLDTRSRSAALSIQDARDLLIELRESEIKPRFADEDASKGLLRKSMLDHLLKSRPTSLQEFQSRLPQQLRSDTDGRQLKEFGERVFEILDRVEG
jgi:very-short-patch-repair endonuclease